MSTRAWFYGLAFSAVLWAAILGAILYEPRILAGFVLAVGGYIAIVSKP